jgi:hypothetical protein
MADALGIVSVISSATVAIAVPFLTSHFQRRERALAREQAAIDEFAANVGRCRDCVDRSASRA